MAGVRHGVRSVMLVLLSALVASCASGTGVYFPVTLQGQRNLQEKGLENTEIIRLNATNISSFSAPRGARSSPSNLSSYTRNWEYRVGVGDVLAITVWDHPELGVADGEASGGAGGAGVTVRSDGNIFFPYVRELRASGRDVSEIQKELTERLAEFIPDPQVSVRVASFNSQKVVVSGEVGNPGTLKVTNIPLTLVEAITQSGGLSDSANGREVRVTRAGQTYFVNLETFLRDGKRLGNPVLRGGDVVFVPDLGNNVAYVLGRVGSPGTVDLGQEGLSLTEAISAKGGLDESQADARGIFVFRAVGDGRYRVFQLDASTPVALALGTKFSLFPQDLIYVVADPAAKWNEVIANLLPSITTLIAVATAGK